MCVSQFVGERWAILYVLVTKLTKETRRRVWGGRDRKGTDWRRRVWRDFLCLSLTWKTCRFTVPPAVALLNYISSGKLLSDFLPNWDISRGFLYVYNFISLVGSAQLRWQGTSYFLASLDQWEITQGPILRFFSGFFIYYSPKATAKLRWAGLGGGGTLYFLGCRKKK